MSASAVLVPVLVAVIETRIGGKLVKSERVPGACSACGADAAFIIATRSGESAAWYCEPHAAKVAGCLIDHDLTETLGWRFLTDDLPLGGSDPESALLLGNGPLTPQQAKTIGAMAGAQP